MSCPREPIAGLRAQRRGTAAVVGGSAMNNGVGNEQVEKQCRECLARQPHCHGTLIHHRGQQPQCTEAGCDHPEILLHSLTIDCEAIGCDCGDPDARRLAV
jgi:hypothetical protein